MDTETSTQFHLSIWRDYTPRDYAPFHSVAIRDEQAGFHVVTPEHRLQAEVYSWSLRQDHLAGVTKEEIRKRLKNLRDELDVSRSPAERSLAVLGDFVAAAERVIEDGEADLVPSESGDETVKINRLLALVLHLKWLIRCFKDRPGVSVSIR